MSLRSPYGWVVYGVPTTAGVRLTASKMARGSIEHVSRPQYGTPQTDLNVIMVGQYVVIEAENWRAALEELYQRWYPDGGPLAPG